MPLGFGTSFGNAFAQQTAQANPFQSAINFAMQRNLQNQQLQQQFLAAMGIDPSRTQSAPGLAGGFGKTVYGPGVFQDVLAQQQNIRSTQGATRAQQAFENQLKLQKATTEQAQASTQASRDVTSAQSEADMADLMKRLIGEVKTPEDAARALMLIKGQGGSLSKIKPEEILAIDKKYDELNKVATKEATIRANEHRRGAEKKEAEGKDTNVNDWLTPQERETVRQLVAEKTPREEMLSMLINNNIPVDKPAVAEWLDSLFSARESAGKKVTIIPKPKITLAEELRAKKAKRAESASR
ncbi:MAG: hypothetical protein QMD05_06645 [Candidatus Brocadiaceae bacterium]|nr:hypothetical protein [Candidatus Brocadiaceae bacterium]